MYSFICIFKFIIQINCEKEKGIMAKIHKFDKHVENSLPVIRVNMYWCKINSRDLWIANEISSNIRCPELWIYSQSFRAFRSIKSFEAHSKQMVPVNWFYKSRHFFYPVLQSYKIPFFTTWKLNNVKTERYNHFHPFIRLLNTKDTISNLIIAPQINFSITSNITRH